MFYDLLAWITNHMLACPLERFVFTCWALWNRQNARIFGCHVKTDVTLLVGVEDYRREFCNTNLPPPPQVRPPLKHMVWMR